VISFRYHIVSIVAVFLAVGLGVLFGTTVVNEGIVSRLDAQSGEFERSADLLRNRVEVLEGNLGRFRDQLGAMVPALVTDQLVGTNVVLVTHDGVDDGLMGEARRALDLSGANVILEMSVTSRISTEDEAAGEELAAILGVEPDAPDVLAGEAGQALAQRLADGRDSVVDPTQDLLDKLLRAGFLVSQGGFSAEDLATIGGDGQVVVVLAGAQRELPTDPGAFLIPLVETLVSLDVSTAAGENFESQTGFVPLVRSESAVAGSDQFVTIDNADEPSGAAALVLALDDLITLGRGGHYGFKDGATAILPPP
jgi:Copper transport outer membrane protein, MctB